MQLNLKKTLFSLKGSIDEQDHSHPAVIERNSLHECFAVSQPIRVIDIQLFQVTIETRPICRQLETLTPRLKTCLYVYTFLKIIRINFLFLLIIFLFFHTAPVAISIAKSRTKMSGPFSFRTNDNLWKMKGGI